MSFINILDILYPVGSIYLSSTSTSPASTIGGTWTQIKGATLAACGANSFAENNYGGSLKMSVSQMPKHQHNVIWTGRDRYKTTSSTEVNAFNAGDGQVTSWAKSKLLVDTLDASGVTFSDGSSGTFTGGGSNFLPYHYGLYVWKRTA